MTSIAPGPVPQAILSSSSRAGENLYETSSVCILAGGTKSLVCDLSPPGAFLSQLEPVCSSPAPFPLPEPYWKDTLIAETLERQSDTGREIYVQAPAEISEPAISPGLGPVRQIGTLKLPIGRELIGLLS